MTTFKLLRAHGRALSGILVLALLEGLCTWSRPLFLKFFVDEALQRSSIGLLVFAVVVMIGLALGADYLRWVHQHHTVRISQQMLATLRVRLFARCIEQPEPFFRQHTSGRLLALLGPVIDELAHLVTLLVRGTPIVLFAAAALAVCAWIAPQLALLLLVPVTLFLGLFVIDGVLRRLAGRSMDDQATLSRFLEQRLRNVPTVRAFGAEEREIRTAETLVGDLANSRHRVEQVSLGAFRGYSASKEIVLAVILLVGGIGVIRHGGADLGTVLAVWSYGGVLFKKLGDLYQQVVAARRALAALDRANEVMQRAEEFDLPAVPRSEVASDGRVEFEDVWFRYGPTEPWALRGVNLDIQAGESVAIVGPSGAGKSSLFQLLLRTLDPQQGTVRIDGADLREFTPEMLQARVGLATQRAVLFDGSVADNIRYGKPEASMAEVATAARAAVADSFIQQLAAGYQTVVREGGGGLSGGEAQRISLARVVLQDTAIVLLDEVTSGLDARTEVEVQAAIDGISEGRTTIRIAHRLSTVLFCDKIVVMEAGRIVQVGSHSELFADREGPYRQLFDYQFQQALDLVA